MRAKSKILLASFLTVSALVAGGLYLRTVSIPILQPKGPIAEKERNLIYIAVALSLIVVVPVYVMLVSFAWKYREGNKKAKYRPDFDHSRTLESIWWGVPLIIILILGTITWSSSHDLDPSKPLSSAPPIEIQVVALQWKWLFIYPQQNVASVNFAQIPLNTPIDFEITSDAPMNSFWVPQLGGQIYAMSGMSTHLHLMATQAGSYQGSSANISGDGFAGMHFIVKAGGESDFNNWVGTAKSSPNQLLGSSYATLALPSQNQPVSYYGTVEDGIYDSVVAKYLAPVYFTPHTEDL